MSDDARSIGFIGLGGMGGGLVRNLLRKGRQVMVADRREEAVAQHVALGATAAPSLAAMATAADILAICVNTAEDVEALSLGPDGLLAAMRPGSILLDHTTTNPEAVRRMSEAAAGRGIAYAEAPMTRTPVHAEQGCVNVLFGGEAALLDSLRPVFALYAENVFHIGPVGHAIRLKLIHNYVAFANVAAWCEGFALAAKDGLDLGRAVEIISAAGGRSGMLDLYGRKTLSRDFNPGISIALARKDVKYYARWLESAGLPGFMADSIHQTYAMAEALGFSEENCAAVIKAYEHFTGIEATLPDGAKAG
ncbi:NAD(P)-dependent oxidoreductase [Teichococcus aestuarii]|uniref:NAD(P)-dependent oxidoreductase n=1 Tax=Teichococcus aestuarii TaxID=568898 RepID=UPI003613C7C2